LGSEPKEKVNNKSPFYFKSFEINVVKVETGTALTIPHLTLWQTLVAEFTEHDQQRFDVRQLEQIRVYLHKIGN
jgi:hypothetical protein